MKKAKIMLLVVAVFATVGATLAFKVKKFGNTSYCYIATNLLPPSGSCVIGVAGAAPNESAPPQLSNWIYYTVTTSTGDCPNSPNLACTNSFFGQWKN